MHGGCGSMKRLRLRVPNTDDWQRYFDPNIAGGGVFCPTHDPPEVGTEVRVEITFVSGPRFFITGVVMWRRPQLNDPRARAGVGIKVHPSERNKVSYVNAWVRGGVIDKREQRRLPVRLRVTYSARAGRRINFTRDLSEEGVFVRSQELLELETKVKLLLVPPGDFKPLELSGTVARHVDDADERGMGIRLDFAEEKSQTKYIEFIQALEQQYLAGQLPDDVVS
jgi:Tfp pilus assembly protein PilZ